MSWRDGLRRVTLPDGRQLIGASFRGVPFFVEASDRSGGRRVVVHEFPLREDPYVEDLGRRARSFRVDGYVVGDDYVQQREALLAALEDSVGPGELIHPSYGALRAICSGLSTRETLADGGMAILSIEFTETPAQAAAPTEQPDPAGQVGASADAAVVATQLEFTETYDPAGLPSFALDSAELALTSLAAELRRTLSPVIRTAQELATLDSQIHQMIAEASSLVRQPAEVLGGFRAVIAGLVETAQTNPGDVLAALVEAYAVNLGPLAPATTTSRVRERANQVALQGAFRQLLAIEAARLAPLVAFESLEAATAARDAVAALLEEQAADAGDTTYPALVSLRAELVGAVPGGAVFARLLTVTRRVPIPSLLLAYQLYGSVDEELDIVARNAIRNPCFVSGDIRVLSSV